jgi:hypothetical protein
VERADDQGERARDGRAGEPEHPPRVGLKHETSARAAAAAAVAKERRAT